MEMQEITTEVPCFEGFECVGWVQPDEGLFVPYYSEYFGVHKLLPAKPDYIQQICYRKIEAKDD